MKMIDSDSDSKGPVLSDNEEEAVESVIAAQTQGHSLHKWSRAELIIPMITIPLNTGIDKIIAAHPDLVQGAETTEQLCTKNIGTPRKLRKWSRGHQFVVRAGGHIDIWQPLYK